MNSSNGITACNEMIDSLNDQQRAAVLYTGGPQLIVAGAGSGKTRVILAKIIYFVNKLGVDPRNILAVTFTNKAADEMRERLSPFGIDANIGTFHALSLKILRTHGNYIGIAKAVTVYDEQDQQSVIKHCLRELKDTVHIDSSPATIVEWISNSKDSLKTPADLANEITPCGYLKLYELYEEKLAGHGALDFGDLILKAVALLNKYPDLRRHYQSRYTHILVDEYQDTNTAQAVFLQLLAGDAKHLCVVGDPDQSIYGWRGANIRNIVNFDDYFPSAKLFKLEKNYRSTENILEASNSLISKNVTRHDKRLYTDRKGGTHIVAYRLQTDRQEADKVADIIKELNLRGISFNEMAVFYRVHTLSRLIEETLIQRGIPYAVIGGLPFYQRKEIKDLIAYLRIMVNPADVVSWRRIINTPSRGIGEKSFEKILEFADANGINFLEALGNHERIASLTRKVHDACGVLFALISETAKQFESDAGWAEIVKSFVDNLGYIDHLRKSDTDDIARQRCDNVYAFIDGIDEYSRRSPVADLADFVESIALRAGVDEWNPQDNAVSLMTLHCAKGLEFTVVLLVGMEERLLPYIRDIETADEVEEERRLCYVGITRAKEQCYLFSCARRFSYSRPVMAPASRFLSEIPDTVIQRVQTDTVSYARRYSMSEEPVASDKAYAKMISEFAPGDKVYHYDMGKGTILGGTGMGSKRKLVILFDGDDQPCMVLESYAGLTKLDE